LFLPGWEDSISIKYVLSARTALVFGGAFAGLNPIDANASSVVALFSGTFSGAWAYRRDMPLMRSGNKENGGS
jgi:hypothetical protein